MPSEIRALEGGLIAEGISLEEMIERAAAFVAKSLLKRFPPFSKTVGLIGKGNNGKDALRALLRLRLHGKRFGIIALDKEAFLREPEAGRTIEHADFVEFLTEDVGSAIDSFKKYKPDVVIDGFFGIGFVPPLPGKIAKLFTFLNEYDCFKVAVDVPSGVSADDGRCAEEAFKADVTFTFFGLKPAHILEPARSLCGKVDASFLGFDKETNEFPSKFALVSPLALYDLLPERAATAHKKTAAVLIVAGSDEMPGAAFLAAKAAFAAGAGYVAVASTKMAKGIILANLPEAVFITLPDDEGAISSKAAERIISLSSDFGSAVIGPGISRTKGALTLAKELYLKLPIPAVIDGDALFVLGSLKGDMRQIAPRVLTPHKGEARILLAGEVSPVDTIEIANKYNSVCVYKESTTIVSDGKTGLFLPYGLKILATAGSGDVLAGAIAAFMSQGMASLEASVVGVLLQAEASHFATRTHGGAPLRASEIVEYFKLAESGMCGGGYGS